MHFSILNILSILLISCSFTVYGNLDSLTFDNEKNLLFDKKPKIKKIKYRKKKDRPSYASVVRLKAQSKRANGTISRTNKKNFKHKKSTFKRQKKQKRYSSKKNHFIIKKSRFDKRTRVRQRSKVRNLDSVKTKH